MSIPSASELDAWVAALEKGQAVTEMLPRFVEGYRRLLAVAEKARPVIAGIAQGEGYDILCLEIDDACDLLDPLTQALDALGPLPEPDPQGALFDQGAADARERILSRFGEEGED